MILPTPGYIQSTLPTDLFSDIKKECHRILKDENNNPNHTHRLDAYRENIETYFCSILQKYNVEKYYLTNAWINYMRKGEFSPPHTHTGDFSFNIWIDIPYYAEDEYNHQSSKYSNKIKPGSYSGAFIFQHTNILGELEDTIIKGDKTFEGNFCLFPAKLTHQVFPYFTSNEIRITVSGNLVKEDNVRS